MNQGHSEGNTLVDSLDFMFPKLELIYIIMTIITFTGNAHITLPCVTTKKLVLSQLPRLGSSEVSMSE